MSLLKFFKVDRGVDVQQHADVVNRGFKNVFGVAAEDRAAADVPGKAQQFRKHRAVEKDRIPAEALIHRDHNLRLLFPVHGNELVDGSRLDERLIRQHH